MALLQNQTLENAMSVSLSIKDVPEEILERLRARAERNHRSLQKELLAIIEAAALEDDEITVDELVEYVKALGISSPTNESTAWIRELRDTRWHGDTAQDD
jgi:plasmid stability protein